MLIVSLRLVEPLPSFEEEVLLPTRLLLSIPAAFLRIF
jgi:hypothetical protein